VVDNNENLQGAIALKSFKENVMMVKLQIQSLSSNHCLAEIQADEQQSVIGGNGGVGVSSDGTTFFDITSGEPISNYQAYDLEYRQYNPLLNALTKTENYHIADQLIYELRGKYDIPPPGGG
jgi:hypothetical protein